MGDQPGYSTTTRAPVSLVGLIGGQWFGIAAGAALASAAMITGDARHLNALPAEFPGRRSVAPPSVAGWLEQIDQISAAGESVCAVASGDPGFFGLGRLASARFGSSLRVFPAPSSVSLAFAAAGVNWDDAVVVSAHGRPLDHAIAAVAAHPKVAVLASPDNPPQTIATALADHGCPPRRMVVASNLGEADERIWEGDISSLAGEFFEGLSVVVALAPDPTPAAPGISWGLAESCFQHRSGMITKAEVRAVALGKLGLPAAGVMWDVGAGSGSVAFECARLAPGMSIFAVERGREDVARMRVNLANTAVEVVAGEAPESLRSLPDPDRVFLGGGGILVLDEVLTRLRPKGTVVATFASFGRAAEAAQRLGNVVQVSVSRGARSGGDGSFRLEAENPVFVCWGPG
ncbi:MAG TPA: precorrin-6y C5,15-methyltransferase (decarboxylating) subunit CbiE [Acidimicrobiales bacterium]|nr:precorrin-6y C5,15-methyltransferase (decarboxylating) subunit CbiE [Acidimicrobiales bacterium]